MHRCEQSGLEHTLLSIKVITPMHVRSRVQKFPAWPTFLGDRNKTTLLFFNIVSLYFNTPFNWYINLTIDGTIYPSQHFPFDAAFVCQAGNFWTLLRTTYHTTYASGSLRMNPQVSKHVEDNRNQILIYKIVRFVGLGCIILSRCKVQTKTLKKKCITNWTHTQFLG